MKSDEIGACRVWVKGDDSCFVVHPDQWEELRTALLTGAAVFEGRGTYDEPLIIRMANVVAINFQTAEVTRQVTADRKADKAQDAIEGNE